MKHCTTVEDIYGAPVEKLRIDVPGWELTNEFRPPKQGEPFLGNHRFAGQVIISQPRISQTPHLILRQIPRCCTIEDIYGMSVAQKLAEVDPNGEFKWTGEFREVRQDEFYLSAVTGGGRGAGVQAGTGKPFGPRMIMEKRPTIKSTYGKELAELKAPEGWKFTGDFRIPLPDEVFMNTFFGCAMSRPAGPNLPQEPRLLLEHVPAPPTIESVYGKSLDELKKLIPKGWRAKEFRKVNNDERVAYVTAMLKMDIYRDSTVAVDDKHGQGYRLVLEEDPNGPTRLSDWKFTVTVREIYGRSPVIPEGYDVVDFRFMQPGDTILTHGGQVLVVPPSASAYNRFLPRLILAPRKGPNL